MTNFQRYYLKLGLKQIPEEQWIDWVDALAEDDYLIIENFISDDLMHRILNYFNRQRRKDQFEKAGIGALQNHQIKRSIRGDEVYWLDEKDDSELNLIFELFRTLIDQLNAYCFLSLKDFESHLAYYPKGTFYARHLDQFKDRNNRLLSMIIYLNEKWEQGHGGELVLYPVGKSKVIIPPKGKQLVLFKSDVIEHEVLPTNVPRCSVTGWLLKQPKSVGYLLG